MKKNVASVITITLICFSLASLIACGSSRKTFGLEEGWEIIGEQKVNFVKDKDVIEVRSRNRFTALRFFVEEKDIKVNDLKIELQNGDKLQPALDDVIKAGEHSRVIELAADGRILNNVEFKYRSMGSVLSGRAKIIIVGRRYNPYGGY